MTVHREGAPIEDVGEQWPPKRKRSNRTADRIKDEAKDEYLEKRYPEKSE